MMTNQSINPETITIEQLVEELTVNEDTDVNEDYAREIIFERLIEQAKILPTGETQITEDHAEAIRNRYYTNVRY